MCGRYTLYHDQEDLTELFEVRIALDAPRYNIAPTQLIPIVCTRQGGERQGIEARWGLIPSWVREPASFRALLFNARSETVGEKAAFRDAARSTRCVVPASGFYEWRVTETGKQPYHVRRRDGAPLVLAGLYAVRPAEPGASSATILTTEPNDLMAKLHDRMPVILAADELCRWLDPEQRDVRELADLLRPCDDDVLEAYPVDRAVGNARIDAPHLVRRL